MNTPKKLNNMLIEFGAIGKTREPSNPLTSVDLVVSSEEIPTIHPIELTLNGHCMENVEEITDTCLYLNISKEGAKRLADLLLEMSNE